MIFGEKSSVSDACDRFNDSPLPHKGEVGVGSKLSSRKGTLHRHDVIFREAKLAGQREPAA